MSDIAMVVQVITSAISTLAGILISNRLTMYRIEQLEKKVEKHNNIVTRTYILEEKVSKLEEA